MSLIGNYSVLSKTCGFTLGGSTVSGDRGNFSKASANRNRHLGGYAQFNSTPSGYVPPHCWVLAKIGGGMATFRTIQGEGEITFGNLAGGLNGVAPLTGSGTISNAALALILSAVAALTGSGTLTASILGKLEAVADLAGSGDLAGALGALADMEADLTGTGALDAVLTALAGISADLVVTGTGLTTSNVGEAVWSALASLNNEAGTMGQKLNAAGGAADPLLNAVPGAYAPGTAGYVLGENLDAKVSEAGGDPAAVWTQVIEAGYSAADILRLLAALGASEASGGGTSSITFKNLAGTKERLKLNIINADGDRSEPTITDLT